MDSAILSREISAWGVFVLNLIYFVLENDRYADQEQA